MVSSWTMRLRCRLCWAERLPSLSPPAPEVAMRWMKPECSGHGATRRWGGHTLARCADGSVWGWGYGRYGALGQAAFRDESLLVQSRTSTGMVEIAAGGHHRLRDDGTVWM